ncbi:MAG TPA: SUMF1/EgtB/PvdO family nonheme iron enzyme, partial [Pirellulales bacterium]|nr:SUMF1/EgtB/PvdO family nonheme iron enzyme [Pirellulales bacterium]
ERQDAERAAGLVNELLHANIDDVPGILERMQDHWSRVEPILKAKDREDLDDAGARLRVALALLSVDESKVVYLKDQLLAATKEEFPVVRDMLTPRATEASLIGPLWAAAEDEKRAAQERFQAACALAALAPTDERWHEISDFVAGHLVTLEPSELAAWRTALRPAAKQLLEPLGAVYRNTTAGELPRTFAAATLADYAADDSDTLFDLLADAEPFQFVRIFNMLKAKPEQAADRCARELAKRPAADAGEDEKESLGKRQANAAVALLKLGEAAKVWPLLGHGPDPRAASYFVHWLGPLQAVPRLLHERLFETVAAPHDATPLAPATPFEKTLFDPDTSLRRTLLLALGEFDEAQLPQRERTRLAEKLWELYRLDPDSGVHSSVDWLLRKWQANDEVRDQIKARLRRVDGELAGSSGGALAGRRWHVNSQGQTMVVVPGPVRSLMGAPADERGRYDDEAQQAVSLDYTFAIASRETTVEQITRWKKDLSYDDKVAPNGDCPINQISWYEAAEYCNWLSDQEGLPKDQWCYVNSDGATVKAKERFWELSGYRLPTEAEWECACRAGTLTSRFYGASESLLGRYAWYTKNSGDIRMLEVGTLKPNALGLFDTLGNACEWCGSAYSDDDRRVLR